MKAHSTDLREKIALVYEHNDYTLVEVAELFAVGRRTVARFVQKHRAGVSLAPQPHAGGYPTTLTAAALATLRDKVSTTPDATLAELASYLQTKAQVQVHPSTVCRALQRLGLPRKKSRWPPPNATEAERLAFRERVARIDRRKLVFTDETGFHLALTRAFGRAPRGERVVGSVPFNRGANHSLIGSLGLRGMVASLLLKGSVDHAVFDAFVNELLLPQVRAGDVLLLDNLPAHQASAVEESAARAKAEVLWLPPYSPDFSPNENCWLKVKTFVRGEQPRTTPELNKAVSAAVQAVTKADIAAWFKHCGY